LGADTAVLVVAVESASPAQKSGVRNGDIIVGYDGHALAGIDDMHKLLTEELIGKTVELRILREARLVTLPVTAEDLKR
ncbi:MAG: PDZ domain-containing protein, partial [Burkholderiales bacterium]